jgi:hypothetical protein
MSLKLALLHMRKGDCLVQTNRPGLRPVHCITGSGRAEVRVSEAIADRLKKHKEVAGSDDALIPGSHQAWRIKRK